MSEQKKYSISFTTGGIFLAESVTTAGLYIEHNDWSVVRKMIIGENLFQARTVSTLKKVCGEVIFRLQLLTPAQLKIVFDGTVQEQKHILWIAICKRYTFIHDFAVEVVREKFLRMDYLLSDIDYNTFFETKAEWYEELELLKDSTKKKIKQVIFRMIHEAEITVNGFIVPAILSKRTTRALLADKSGIYIVLPVSDRDIKEWVK